MIHVGVTQPPGRKNWYLVWVDPQTGAQRRQSTGERRKRDAETKAREFAARLNLGLGGNSWVAFRDKYFDDHVSGLAPRTQQEYRTAVGALEVALHPETVEDITEASVASFVTKLRGDGLEESTIAKYVREIQAMLNKAKRWKVIAVAPTLDRPARAKAGSRQRKSMKGRPITREEFDRMLAATAGVVGSKAAASWRHLLRGLWVSGFRLSEALELTWDNPSKLMIHDLSARRPTVAIPAELQKSGRDDPYYPLTPDFAELLRRTPAPQRTGWVFEPLRQRQAGSTRNLQHVSDRISDIGKAAGVVVHSTADGAGDHKESVRLRRKFASAQDLRRSFGTRWAPLVKPFVLKELMRHDNIATTEKFYVAIDAEELADAIWAGFESAKDRIGRTASDHFCDHLQESVRLGDAEK